VNVSETTIEKWAIRYARVAIGVSFLSAVAGRFGLWNGAFEWDRFGRFIVRAGSLNAWAPAALAPFFAWSATIFETTFGIALILGLATRWVALGSAGLLAWFALSMFVYDGPKAPFDYSVFSASAGALLLALAENRARRSSSNQASS
jgi:putative oxidoreductase